MPGLQDAIDATEWVLSWCESSDDAAYAEVGAVDRDVTDGVATPKAVRSATDLTETGVWWRLFAGGSADYRYTSSLSEDHLEDLLERSVRAATQLDQRVPARYDRGTTHRALHPGWGGDPPLTAWDAAETLERVCGALADATADLALDRARVTYRDEHETSVVSTTTGTTVRTTLERASAEAVFAPDDGPKVHRHFGSTTGTEFVASLPERFDAMAERVRERSDAERTTAAVGLADLNDPGESDRDAATVVFGPRAAGELFHQLSHYFEIDSVYIGASPVVVGDRVGPSALHVEDGVRAGSWAARAYDSEGRPTQSVALVADGVARNRLYDTPSAVEENAFPAGSVVPSVGYERPPRVHARHLDVRGGEATVADLCDGADVYVEAVGEPRTANEASRTKRASGMPPSVLYARDIGATTPSEFDDETADQRLVFPVEAAFIIEDGERTALFADGAVSVSFDDFRSLSLGARRETTTGTCSKHRSTLPFAVTAPAVRTTATIRPS